MARTVVQAITLAAAVANGVALSQTPLAAGALTLNGSLVSGGVAQLTPAGSGVARQVLLTFAADETGHSFALTGTNATGNTVSETIAGTTAGTVASANTYQTLTSAVISAAATGAMTVGTNGVGTSRIINLDTALNPSNTSVIIGVTGTVNYTLRYTLSDIQDTIVWSNDPVLSAQTAGGGTAYAMPISGLQVLINSGTGTVTATVLQSGLGS